MIVANFRKFCLLSLVFIACGSSNGTPEPQTQASSDEAKSNADEGASQARDDEALDSPKAKPAPRCANRACSECGDAVCPPGMFCVRYANAEPACSWLPQCASADRCECITAALGPGCRCESAGDSIRAVCD
jgi:hypothetical protein